MYLRLTRCRQPANQRQNKSKLIMTNYSVPRRMLNLQQLGSKKNSFENLISELLVIILSVLLLTKKSLRSMFFQ